MKICKISVLLPFAFVMCFSLFSAPAHAQASRTWISGVGDDVNPCSRTAPCKTFAGAISKTAPGGEIDALDPGGFGAVTITKAITLDGGGGQVASILAANSNGINVNAGASDVVIIRNLRINGISQDPFSTPGINGISLNSGGALIVEKCDIFGFASSGINVVTSTAAKVSISETHIQNVGTNANTAGVLIQPSANVLAMISKSYIEHSLSNGVFANGGGAGVIRVNVRDSVITDIGATGVQITSGGTAVSGEVINTQISNTVTAGAGVSGASASLTLGANAITNNVNAVSSPSGTLQSYKNNMIADNVNNGTPINAVAGYANGTGQ
jgi:hypothetical protein